MVSLCTIHYNDILVCCYYRTLYRQVGVYYKPSSNLMLKRFFVPQECHNHLHAPWYIVVGPCMMTVYRKNPSTFDPPELRQYHLMQNVAKLSNHREGTLVYLEDTSDAIGRQARSINYFTVVLTALDGVTSDRKMYTEVKRFTLSSI